MKTINHKLPFFMLLFMISMNARTQTVSSSTIASTGNTASAGGVQLSWTAGSAFTTTLDGGGTLLTQGFQQPELQVWTGTVNALLYKGKQVFIPYTASGIISADNQFTAELSDNNGDFSAPVSLGTYTGNVHGVLAGRIPSTVANGTRYRIRVRSSLPQFISPDNGLPLEIRSAVTFSGRVVLQGAYNQSTGIMNNTLNTSGLLQAAAVAQPYNMAAFGNYAGTETVASGFFAAHPSIVDWVLLELRDAANAATVVAKRAAFVTQNGTLVETDGVRTGIEFPDVEPGAYFVSIRHRNHLGIRSAAAVDFAATGAASYDFTTASNSVFQSQAYTSTVQLQSVWAMRGGDANSNGDSKYSGSGNDRGFILTALGNRTTFTGYHPADLNMDGVVKYSGSGNDRGFLFNNVLQNTGLTRLQQLY